MSNKNFLSILTQTKNKAYQSAQQDFSKILKGQVPIKRGRVPIKRVLVVRFDPAFDTDNFVDFLEHAKQKNIPVYLINTSNRRENDIYQYLGLNNNERKDLIRSILPFEDIIVIRKTIMTKENIAPDKIHYIQLGNSQHNKHVVCSQDNFFRTVHDLIQQKMI